MESHTEELTESVFQMTEDFISKHSKNQQRDQSGRKRKLNNRSSEENPKLISVFTPQWRAAVIRFAEGIPMDLLVQEFNRYYNVLEKKRIMSSETKKKVSNAIRIPPQILENIFLRMPLEDLLTCRSVCGDWNEVYESKSFQDEFQITSRQVSERCIVINNNNLDMWAFSVMSKRWFLIKVPCDWDSNLKTLGIKAGSQGLFLVARSDFSLFVVNPVTAQVKKLPRISRPSGNNLEFLNSLIVQGTAEMIVHHGKYNVYLFGNCVRGQSYIHVAKYSSRRNLWTVKQIGLVEPPYVLYSRLFPSPLRSVSHPSARAVTIYSATSQYFCYFPEAPFNRTGTLGYDLAASPNLEMSLPAAVESDYVYNNKDSVTLPTVVPCALGMILVGRFKGNACTNGMYGRFPIVRHSVLGLWKFNHTKGKWKLIDTTPTDLIKSMVESSEGTDFLVTGDGSENIWLMLRGSDKMLQYGINTKEWQALPGCPGGGNLAQDFHWRVVYKRFIFSTSV